MTAPHETHSAEFVSQESFLSISRVVTDHQTEVLATGALDEYRIHKKLMAELKTAQEERMLSEGRLASAQRRTDLELQYFSQRLAAAHASYPKKGEASSQYRYVFNDSTPAKVLPPEEDERLDEIAALLERADDAAQAGVQAATLLGSLLPAIEAERQAVADCKRLRREEQAARRNEEIGRRKLVAAVRSMNKDVQSLFSDSPSTARRILGHRNPAVARRRNARLAAKATQTAATPNMPVPPGPVARGPLTPPGGPAFDGMVDPVRVESASPPEVHLNGSAPVPELPAAPEQEEG